MNLEPTPPMLHVFRLRVPNLASDFYPFWEEVMQFTERRDAARAAELIALDPTVKAVAIISDEERFVYQTWFHGHPQLPAPSSTD